MGHRDLTDLANLVLWSVCTCRLCWSTHAATLPGSRPVPIGKLHRPTCRHRDAVNPLYLGWRPPGILVDLLACRCNGCAPTCNSTPTASTPLTATAPGRPTRSTQARAPGAAVGGRDALRRLARPPRGLAPSTISPPGATEIRRCWHRWPKSLRASRCPGVVDSLSTNTPMPSISTAAAVAAGRAARQRAPGVLRRHVATAQTWRTPTGRRLGLRG